MVLLAALAASCQQDEASPLTVHDLTVYAPLPGQPSAVACFTLENHTDIDVVLDQVSSPQFAAAEIHETQLINGIAHMSAGRSPVVSAGSSLLLAEGGMHVMLNVPREALDVGDPVVLQIHCNGHGVIEARAPLRPRIDAVLDD